MRRGTSFLGAMVGLVAFGACGGGGFSGGLDRTLAPPEPVVPTGMVLDESVGNSSVDHVVRAMRKVVMDGYAFSLKRRAERFESLYYETEWVVRPPTTAVRSQGVPDTRHRVVIEGRRSLRRRGRGGSVVFRMVVRIENEALISDLWEPMDSDDSGLEENMRQMVSELREEIRILGDESQ